MSIVRTKRWFRFTWQALLFIAVLFAVHLYVTRNAVTGAAPPLAGTLLSGEPVSLQQFRGQPLLVHFWASWCGICRLEQSSIAALARDHHVITIAMQSGGAAAVEKYLHRHKLHMPVLLDPRGTLARRYGVRGVPTSFVVDGNGEIRFVEVGYTTGLGLRLRLWWAGLRARKQ
jgi:thiol-disulfide isomerase/thioredoxin